jgi:hypothetical protein
VEEVAGVFSRSSLCLRPSGWDLENEGIVGLRPSMIYLPAYTITITASKLLMKDGVKKEQFGVKG